MTHCSRCTLFHYTQSETASIGCLNLYCSLRQYSLPKPAFQQEGEEVGEGVELTVESDVSVAQLYAIFDVGISSVCHLLQRGSGVVVGFHFDRNERLHVAHEEVHFHC